MSAPTTPRPLPELTRESVGALRDTLRELDRAIKLSRELHDEAVLLTEERDRAIEARENMRALFDDACNVRDLALEELSSVKASLADIAKRWRDAEAKVIEYAREPDMTISRPGRGD